MLGDFLKNERKLVEFDKDVFMQLIGKVVVKGKNDITFVFTYETEEKAIMPQNS